MKKTFFAAVFGAALAVTGCGFEHSSLPAAPSGPSAPSPDPGASTGDNSSGALTGVWSSPAVAAIPAGTTCHEFQWRITSQTTTYLSGEFYANCSAGIVVRGVASGQLNGSDVTLGASGTATLPGILSCPFSLNGTGQIQGNNESMNLQYSGTTCVGPVSGTETLRRPAPSQPEPPAPAAPEPPPPSDSVNPYHVGDGPLSYERAEAIVHATGEEYSYLRAPRSSESEAIGASEELLLRIIWHLKLGGFDAGRQRNPSGAISNDKLTIFINGSWHAFDVFLDLGHAGQATQTIFYEVSPPGPVGTDGIPD
jgi:hypothetical protein